jgi:hypothetical protein
MSNGYLNGYLLFAGNTYYPECGADDMQGLYLSCEDAMSAYDASKYQYSGGWAHILSLETMTVVKRLKDREDREGLPVDQWWE